MNVSLTPELERRIAEKVESGLYTTASEVVRESLRLLFERDELKEHRLGRLQDEIQVGLDQADRGELIPGETARSEVTRRLNSRRKQG